MIEHNKNFYSLEELKRTRDSLEGYLDNEEVYYFVGAIRYACDEIERLNNKLKDIKSQLDYLETYSSKEDVFEDMKRRLDRIEDIVNRK